MDAGEWGGRANEKEAVGCVSVKSSPFLYTLHLESAKGALPPWAAGAEDQNHKQNVKKDQHSKFS